MKETAEQLYRKGLAGKKSVKYESALVEGHSMWPELRPGYKVFYRKTDSIEIGNMIVLEGRGRRREHRLKVHRVIHKVGPYYLETGDNSFAASLIAPENILGVVEWYEDNNGRRAQPAAYTVDKRRDRFFQSLASGFMFTHELKDRWLGDRKSLILWKISKYYRNALRVAGLDVPTIFPR